MIFKSPYPSAHFPEIPLTDFVFEHALQRAAKNAIIDGFSSRAYTYGDLYHAIRRAAFGLAERGFRKGDVLALYSPNMPEYPIAFHAASSLGGIVTTINPLFTARELAQQLNDSRASFLVTVPPLLDKVQEAVKTSSVREIYVFGASNDAKPFSALLQNSGAITAPEINPRSDIVALPYSSGTTGFPKGVMLTHHNLVANMIQIDLSACHTTESDTIICVLPMFHIYGMAVVMNLGLRVGATIITMPRFDFESLLKIMQQYEVSFAHLVPPIILALAKNPIVDQYKFPALKAIFSGAAPLGPEVIRACKARLGCLVRQGYGLTETSPATHLNLAEITKDGSVGVCVANTECKIVDISTGKELGSNQPGEIWVRGPQVMKGYLNAPDATAAILDSDGWLKTGDIGYADEEGHFYIVDRVKELIKYHGCQVPPAELEALLLGHPDVLDAAVIPSPDPEAGEVPKAFIVPKSSNASLDAILEFVAANVAPTKKIRKAEFIDQIPKSPSGKILRRLLVERERAKG